MNKVSKLLFVIVILNFVLIEYAFAQNKADTIRAVLPYAHGMTRADILNELSWEIKASDPENSFILAQEALESVWKDFVENLISYDANRKMFEY